MTAATIAQLIIALGPSALELIPKLAGIWSKPELTVDEVVDICKGARQSYDAGLAEARARLGLSPA
jgi:hypothetical protein